MCTRKTSLSLLLFFVSIIYFTIRKVNPLCEKNVLFAGRSSQNHASWTCYVYHHLFAAGRPLGRPLRCGHKAAKTSHEPLTTNNKKSTGGHPTSPAESRVSLSDRILSLHQVTRFGISDSHGFARRRAPSKPVPCLSQGTLVG